MLQYKVYWFYCKMVLLHYIYKTVKQSAPYNCTKWLSDYWAWNGKQSILVFNIFVVTILIPA